MNKLIVSVLLLMMGGTTLGMYKKEEIQAVELNDSAAISQEHTKQIKHIHFFNDGSMLSIGQDKAVYWNDKFQKTKEVNWDNVGMPLVVASSNDYIAIAHSYKKISIYKPDLTLKTEFDFEKLHVEALCFVNDNQLVAAMSDGIIILLDISNGLRRPYTLRHDKNTGEKIETVKIKALKYNKAKEILHISWDDGAIGQWDVCINERLPALELETNTQVIDFAYSQDKMLTVSDDEYMRIWEAGNKLGSYKVQATFNCGKKCSVIAVSSDGSLAAVAHFKGIDIFDITNNELIEKVNLPTRAQKLCFTPDNTLIISTGKQLFKHMIAYELVKPAHIVNNVQDEALNTDTPEQRYFAAWETFATIKNEENIQERISNLKALLTKTYHFGSDTEKAFRIMIQQKIATSYFDYAMSQKSARDRYSELVALKNSTYLNCFDFAEKAEFERKIQNEINKVGLVSSLWFTWSGKAKSWLSNKVTNTLMKLTPLLP
ncbi:MAG: hypothetical protein ACOYT8_02705 [Candidatus Dependentiae bacterium]